MFRLNVFLSSFTLNKIRMNSISVLHINLFQSEKNAPDFYFNTLKNHLVSSHKHIEKPHRHDFYVTVIFTKGQGIHEIDFQKYDVSEGSLFFLSTPGSYPTCLNKSFSYPNQQKYFCFLAVWFCIVFYIILLLPLQVIMVL